MIKRKQFVMLVKSLMDYNNRISQFTEEYGDCEIARFGDMLAENVQEFIQEIMDETKKNVLEKWIKGYYVNHNLYEQLDGHLIEGLSKDIGTTLECNKSKIVHLNTIGQLYDFLLKKKKDSGKL